MVLRTIDLIPTRLFPVKSDGVAANSLLLRLATAGTDPFSGLVGIWPIGLVIAETRDMISCLHLAIVGTRIF